MVVYRLRPEARFHDGKPMTPEDVIWSMETLRESHPFYNSYYKNITKAEQTGEHEVTFVFSREGQPRIAADHRPASGPAQALVDRQRMRTGKPRNIQETTLEVPLGSGPYAVADVKPGASIAAEAGRATIGARTCRSISARIISTRSRSSISAMPMWRSRPSRATSTIGASRTAPRTGRPAMIFRPSRTAASSRKKFTLKKVEGMQSFVFNMRRREVPGCAGAPRLQLCLRFRMVEYQSVLRPVHCARAAISTIPRWKPRACRRRRNWRSSSR